MTVTPFVVACCVVGLGVVYRPRSLRAVVVANPARPVPTRPTLSGRIGASIATVFGYQLDPAGRLARQVGAAVLVIPVFVVAPGAGVVALGWAVSGPVLAERRQQRRHERRLLTELPEVIDLLAVAVSGGRTVPLAIDDVVGLVPGSVTDALARCRRRAGLGKRLADELDSVPAAEGELVRPLVRALVAAERYGTPIAPSLEIAAADVRLRRRREAERRARQLPVKMLFPLVICVLPAFALLTVVPVLVDAFSVLRQ